MRPFAIPAFVAVVWVRKASSLRRRKASVSVQAFVGKRVSSIEIDGEDLSMGRPS